MTEVRIYRPSRTAMQSGEASTRRWVLEFEPEGRQEHDPLMGWIGSADVRGQVRLEFHSKEDAVAFATKHGLVWRVQEPATRRTRPKSYAQNFRYQRLT